MSSFDASLASPSRSYNYDVFLSFSGGDTRKTFVSHFYTALISQDIRTYKDNISLCPGESIRPALRAAIEESRIAVIVFSKTYADSTWCLDELVHIMKCRGESIVLPIFYDVEPSELRKKTRFSRKRKLSELKNEEKYEPINDDKGQILEPSEQVSEREEALVAASEIAGWVINNTANGDEAEAIKQIVDGINMLLHSNSYIDKDLIGMGTRVQGLKLQLAIRSKDVCMVGIWGLGGIGKSTLATSLYVEMSQNFQFMCIVENVREVSRNNKLKKVQARMLLHILNIDVKVHSVDLGKREIKSRLSSKKVLVLLDDVDTLGQLEALVGKRDWFGNGSIIIITTRDEHLLKTHKVDHIYEVSLLSDKDAMQLFNRYAFNENDTIKNYNKLSLSVVRYAAGLPLALKVLGSFLYDKDENVWNDTLARLKSIPETDIVEQLRISYDGLKPLEKELFLDIACFYRRKMKNEAMEILEACDFYPKTGIEVLRQKALIKIVDGRFDMHDLIQQMGHYIVRGEYPNNPEKHKRVWKYEEIQKMYSGDATMENENIEAIRYTDYSKSYLMNARFCEIVSNMKKLRGLRVWMLDGKCHSGPDFLSSELRYIHWDGYPATPFPDNFQLRKLVVLKLSTSMQKEIWNGDKYLP